MKIAEIILEERLGRGQNVGMYRSGINGPESEPEVSSYEVPSGQRPDITHPNFSWPSSPMPLAHMREWQKEFQRIVAKLKSLGLVQTPQNLRGNVDIPSHTDPYVIDMSWKRGNVGIRVIIYTHGRDSINWRDNNQYNRLFNMFGADAFVKIFPWTTNYGGKWDGNKSQHSSITSADGSVDKLLRRIDRMVSMTKTKATYMRPFTKSQPDKNAGVQEGWSEKYKRSIDCSRPKGFSQRAHCQGRKANEEVELDEDSMSLHDWFGKGKHGGAGGGGWDRYNTKGERIGKCGERKPDEGKPKCLSKSKAASLRASGGKEAIASAVNKKRRNDPNANRRGSAKNVSNKPRKE